MIKSNQIGTKNSIKVALTALTLAVMLTGCGDGDNTSNPNSFSNIVYSSQERSYSVASDVAASTRFIQYYMPKTGVNNQNTLSTAVVFTPKTTPPNTGWPIIVWAHGTTGVGDACAPSASNTLASANVLIARLVEQGYVVVAPDYEGLGSDGTHPFLNAQSEGNSVIYAAIAAHQAVPRSSNQWMVVGHSQGGHAAIAAAERQASVTGNPLNFKGAVAYAPASNLDTIINIADNVSQQALNVGAYESAINAQAGINTFAAYVLQGIKQTSPSVDFSSVFGTDGNTQTIVASANTQCINQVGSAFGSDIANFYYAGNSGLYKGLKSTYLSVPSVKTFIDTDSKLATKSVTQPMVIVQGKRDTTVPYPATELLVSQLKNAGTTNITSYYTETDDHGSVISNNIGQLFQFLATNLPAK